MSDFKAKADTKSPYFAMTYTKISHAIRIENNQLNIQLYHIFDSQKSWMKKAKADSALLAHEQLHFDLSELYARKTQMKLQQMKPSKNVIKQINELISKELTELNQEQDRYDEETQHGILDEKQKIWSEEVGNALKAYPQALSEIQFPYTYPVNGQ